MRTTDRDRFFADYSTTRKGMPYLGQASITPTRQMPGSMPMGQPDPQPPSPVTPNTSPAPDIPGQGQR